VAAVDVAVRPATRRDGGGTRLPDPVAPHPANGLDDIVHQRSRLGVLAILREADRVEFSYLRDALGLTDGNLSRHLRTLEGVGYIEIQKGYQGRRPRTWLRLTRAGRGALDKELTALRTLMTRLDLLPGEGGSHPGSVAG